MRNAKAVLIFFILSSLTGIYPQSTPDCDLRFINHLIQQRYYEEVLFLLDSDDCSSFLMNDSANFFRGWSYFSLNRPDSSAESLIKVKPSSAFYLKSRFYAAYIYSQKGDFPKAAGILENIDSPAYNYTVLRNTEIAGIKLLQWDLPSFDNWYDGSLRDQVATDGSGTGLMKISQEMKNHGKRSPLIAGLLSAIIPGSGKFYAGNRGESVATFISTAGIGLVTWENYHKRGPDDFRTIVFGTIFAISYLANIYGSAFSVTIAENEYMENVKNTILFNLRIPIDAQFNK